MADIDIILEAGKHEVDQRNNNDTGTDHAKGCGQGPGNFMLFVADENTDIDRDDAGQALTDCIVVNDFLFRHPVPFLHNLPPQDRQHRIPAAKRHRAHAEEQ